MNRPSLLIALSIVCFVLPSDGFSGQEDGKSSRREVAVIAAIEAAGGRVNKISAADESREINFHLSRNPVRDEQIKDLGGVREVIWCNLAGTEITDDGLKHLAGMPLRKLHLERTKITDKGLRHLTACKDLEYLNLYGTKITDAGLDHLRELRKLKKLYVWQTGVTESGMEKLNQALPDLKIVSEVKLEAKVIEAQPDAPIEQDGQAKQPDQEAEPGAENAESKETKPDASEDKDREDGNGQ